MRAMGTLSSGLALLLFSASGGSGVVCGTERTSEGESAADLAVLKSELSYSQITAFDGQSRPLVEDRWALVAGPHVLHFECQAVFGEMNNPDGLTIGHVETRRTWQVEVDLASAPEAGRIYVARDFADPSERGTFWIEDTATGDVMAGRRAKVLDPFTPKSATELLEARAALGTGAKLVVDYKAPKKPVRKFEVYIRKRLVVQTSGNEDLRLELDVEPGYHQMEVVVQSLEVIRDFGERLDLDLEEGQTRTLHVKGKHWGRSSVRLH